MKTITMLTFQEGERYISNQNKCFIVKERRDTRVTLESRWTDCPSTFMNMVIETDEAGQEFLRLGYSHGPHILTARKIKFEE